MRSPLTRLSLAAGLLRQRPPEETGEYLDRIELETEQLDKLIAQLLTLSRIESCADAGPAKEEIDLANLIQEIAVDGNFEAQARSCMVCVGPLDSCVTLGSPDQIRRAIENVVRNVIRYTKERSQVEIILRRQGTLPSARAAIQVRDYGPGVPDSDLGKIFLPLLSSYLNRWLCYQWNRSWIGDHGANCSHARRYGTSCQLTGWRFARRIDIPSEGIEISFPFETSEFLHLVPALFAGLLATRTCAFFKARTRESRYGRIQTSSLPSSARMPKSTSNTDFHLEARTLRCPLRSEGRRP